MRVIIAGGRYYPKFGIDEKVFLEALHMKYSFTEIITGGTTGVDTWGYIWAKFQGITQVVFPANWKGEGRAAGPKRNQRMLNYLCDMPPPVGSRMAEIQKAVICFPGGKGTQDMRQRAIAHGITVFEYVE